MGMGPLFRRELRCEAPVSYRVDVDRKREAKQREKAHARETSRRRRICGAGLRPKRCSSLSLFLFSLSFALSSSTTKCIGSNKLNLVFSPSLSLSSPPVDPSNSAESSRALERGRSSKTAITPKSIEATETMAEAFDTRELAATLDVI